MSIISIIKYWEQDLAHIKRDKEFDTVIIV